MISSLAPGSRIIARDEEWLVRRVDLTPSGAHLLTVTGLSPLVRNREAAFIDRVEELDEPIQLIDPKTTKPAPDDSPYYRDTRLFLEALLRQSVPPDTRLTLGHRGAMDLLPYQLDPARLALQQPRQRILIADAVGLGKTIECGILLTEMIRRGRGRRILVLTVKSMMTQFQKELWARFSIPLVRLDSTGLQRVRTRIPSNHNPFHYFDKTIISIDTIKQDGEYRNHLENAWWDIIVIDEAHNVARRGTNSMRARVAELLSSRSDSLILLSATPHDGRRESFASIMNMLNPTAIKDDSNYGPDDIAANLKKLCSREEWERIEVINLDAWARRFLEKQGFPLKLTYEDSSHVNLWEKALELTATNFDFSPEFIRGEWDNVIQAQGIEKCESYLTASRVGRGRRLTRQERKQLWPVFEEYRALLTERGLSEPADAFRAATKLIVDRNIVFPYRAALVDEAQDFGNEAFRLVRAIVPAVENDLFIVGDAHQRIYGHQVVLSRCGIDIRGRGRKLRINYRTTEELKNWAAGLLTGLSFDDLDAGTDDAQGVRSLLHGEPPVVKTCTNETAVAEAISDHVKQLIARDQAKPESICVVAGTHKELDEYQKYLKQVCPAIHQIEPGKAEDSATPGLRMATVHRVKGLEFDHVILAGKLDEMDAVDDTSERFRQKRALLYVAATRARCSLFVCRFVT